MMHLYKCILGPRLFRIYNLAQQSNESSVYKPNSIEHIGNNIVHCINVIFNIGLFTSPLVITYLYKRDYFCLLGCISLGRIATGIGILFVIGLVIRGIGRFWSPSYGLFLNVLQRAQMNYSDTNKKALAVYDYEYWAAPVDFSVTEVEGHSKPYTQVDSSHSKVGPIAKIFGFPCHVTAYFLMHLFGRHLIYPGSIHFVQYLMGTFLDNGREKLVTENKGIRNKILSIDGNEIDTIFIDQRNNPSKNDMYGSTLVVCCEGNAGFYEVGTVTVPVEAGYSVLGWNHPGFAGSTGKPFPSQDQHAIDAVMQFAIHKLKFQPQDIIIYAWSIGGYSGTWAAMNYPQIRGLVLDATFDDILPLAIPRMPGFMSGLVKRSVREFMNLNVAEQLCRYPGPITIIRRTKDEIITTREGDISANRGNNLLLKLLNQRYPKLLNSNITSETLKQWIYQDSLMQDAIYRSYVIDDELCLTKLISYIKENGESYPMSIGSDWNEEEKCKMILFLASNILVNFDSSHNNPLEKSYLRVPWTPMADLSYVQL